MADLRYTVTTGEGAFTSTPKTAILLTAPTNQRIKILGIEVTGQGTSNTDTPVKVEIGKATSISGGTAGSVTTQKHDDDMAETIQTTVAGMYSAEPTYTGLVVGRPINVHPQFGVICYYPLDQEIKLKGGQVFMVRVTTNQSETLIITVIVEE